MEKYWSPLYMAYLESTGYYNEIDNAIKWIIANIIKIENILFEMHNK